MNNLFSIHLAIILTLKSVSVFAHNSITGVVTDGFTQDPIIIVTVALYSEGVLVTGTETDFDGRFTLDDISPGKYDIEASYVGYIPKRLASIVVGDTDLTLNISINGGVHYHMPKGIRKIEVDAFTQGRTITFRNNGVIDKISFHINEK